MKSITLTLIALSVIACTHKDAKRYQCSEESRPLENAIDQPMSAEQQVGFLADVRAAIEHAKLSNRHDTREQAASDDECLEIKLGVDY